MSTETPQDRYSVTLPAAAASPHFLATAHVPRQRADVPRPPDTGQRLRKTPRKPADIFSVPRRIRARAADFSLAIRLRPGAPLPAWDRELSLALDRAVVRSEVGR